MNLQDKLVLLNVPLMMTVLLSAQQSIIASPVINGDTFEFSTDKKVRLIGIDTLETEHPSKPVEFYGKEASAFTRQLL